MKEWKMEQSRMGTSRPLSKALTLALVCLVCFGLTAVGQASAAGDKTLNVGASTEPVTLDPHAIATASVISMCANIFDSLVFVDEELKTQPGLAEKWENTDPLTWVFHLRKNVKFHNGAPFTAEDVKFSIDRAKNWEKSGVKSRVRFISKIEIVDPHTIKLSTDKPFAPLARFLYWVPIMSKAYVEAKGQDYQATNPIGTGKYKLKEWIKGDHFTLIANKDYFGGAPAIKTVRVRPLNDDAARTAALLSGEVQLIDYVPVRDAKRIEADKKLKVMTKPSTRCIYIYMDQDRAKSPKIKADKNPFMNKKVRRAMALAINKKALVKFVMNGFAVPADQMYPLTVTGSDPTLKGPGYDLKKAKQLLKEAGYPNGFEVVFDTTNDDFANDDEIAQAVGAQLAKIGIKVKVNAAPKKIIYSIQGRRETSLGTSYWTSSMGDAIRFLDNCAHSNSKEKGLGRWNIGGYGDKEVDALIEQSGESVDQKVRTEAMQKAQRIFLGRDQGFIPLYFPVNVYGVSADLKFTPSATAHLIYGRMSWAK